MDGTDVVPFEIRIPDQFFGRKAMNKRKAENIQNDDAEIPKFMRGHEGKGHENLGPRHVVWLPEGADDLGDSPDLALSEKAVLGYERYLAIQLLLLAIIKANPDNSVSPEKRLELVIKTLLGQPNSRGRSVIADDDEILEKIAVEYLLQYCNFKPRTNLTAIIKALLGSELEKLNAEQQYSKVHRFFMTMSPHLPTAIAALGEVESQRGYFDDYS